MNVVDAENACFARSPFEEVLDLPADEQLSGLCGVLAATSRWQDGVFSSHLPHVEDILVENRPEWAYSILKIRNDLGRFSSPIV